MNSLYDQSEELDDSGVFDPLSVQRSAPLEDEEAALVEALCHAATPGPLVVDDETTGDGAVVASLPDGRLIVSLSATVEHAQGEAVAHANAELICKARYLLLRLLRDRQQWKDEREFLLERIRTLEAALGTDEDSLGQRRWNPTTSVATYPR